MLTILCPVLALCTIFVNVKGKHTCLAPKEKTIIKTIRNSMQQLNSQITGLEDSLKHFAEPIQWCHQHILEHVRMVVGVDVEAGGALIVTNPGQAEMSDRLLRPKLQPIAGPLSLNDDIIMNDIKDDTNVLKIYRFVTVIETSGCQKGWTRYRNHCYYFGLNKLDWFEAQRYCYKHGSTLAKIDDATENAWISAKTNELKLHDVHLLWLGGSDPKEGQWIWMADFSPFTYVNWNKGTGEPNGGTSENCLNMLNYQTYKGTWNDSLCDNKKVYLCKKNLRCDCN